MSNDNDHPCDVPGHIDTEGDFSPGFVAGNYKVTINNYNEYTRKRVWRTLESLRFPILSSREAAVDNFLNHLMEACSLMLGDEYRQFTAHFGLMSQGTEVAITMIANQPDIMQRMRKSIYARLTEVEKIKVSKNAGHDFAVFREEYQKYVSKLLNEWDVNYVDTVFTLGMRAVRFELDGKSKRIDVRPAEQLSLDVSTYPKHLQKTSELIQFIGALQRTQFVFLDNFELFLSFYPLVKFISYTIDKKMIGLEKIRIDHNDVEAWDFEYPEYDHEVINAGGTPKRH